MAWRARRKNPARGTLPTRAYAWESVAEYGASVGASWPTTNVAPPSAAIELVAGLSSFLSVHLANDFSAKFAQQTYPFSICAARSRNGRYNVGAFAAAFAGLTALLYEFFGPEGAVKALQGLVAAQLNVLQALPQQAAASYGLQARTLLERAAAERVRLEDIPSLIRPTGPGTSSGGWNEGGNFSINPWNRGGVQPNAGPPVQESPPGMQASAPQSGGQPVPQSGGWQQSVATGAAAGSVAGPYGAAAGAVIGAAADPEVRQAVVDLFNRAV